jgi:hypothetical protein
MLPSAVCCFITAYYPILSSAETREATEFLVGIVSYLLTGSQQNCTSVPCSGKRLFSVPRQQYQLWGGTGHHLMGTKRTSKRLCDLVVQLNTHPHFVLPVRTKWDILHIDMLLTADIKIASIALNKNCLKTILLSSCSHTTATVVRMNL